MKAIGSRVSVWRFSDAALRKLLRKLTGDNATVHGLRSTFRDWVAECTDYKPEVAEAALAHALGDDVETAYWRTDQFDQRVKLMGDWAAFLEGELAMAAAAE